MKRELVAFSVALACCATLARAQSTCTALGVVVDADGQPLPDVQVLMEYKGHIPQKYRTKTDKKGRFMHVNVYEGAYKLTFTKEGYGEVSLETGIRELSSTEKSPEYRIAKKALPAAPPAAAGDAPPRRTPAEATAEIQAAADFLKAGKLDEAEAAYQSLLAKAPQVPDLHFNLALVQQKKHAVAPAEASFRKAVELDPKFADAWSGLAVLLIEAGKGGEALQALEQGVAANPDDKRLLYAEAVTYMNTNKLDEAQEAFTRLEAMDSGNPEVQYHLATLALNRNRTSDAIVRLEKYLSLASPDAPNVATAKGILAALKGKK